MLNQHEKNNEFKESLGIRLPELVVHLMSANGENGQFSQRTVRHYKRTIDAERQNETADATSQVDFDDLNRGWSLVSHLANRPQR
ncbi:MAG: hypothetical protein ABGZ53_30665 [Fuerstiella sp.]